MEIGDDMKIAIIGSEGIIGKKLVDYLCRRGMTVYGYDLIHESQAGNKSHDNYYYSCTGETGVCYSGIDGIVILAAKRPVTEFLLNDYFHNISIVYDIVNNAILNNVNNIIFASSVSAYSQGRLPFDEADYCIPTNLYGASKTACEQIGLLLTKNSQSNFVALRFAHVIGANEKKGFFIRTVIDNAIEKRKQIVYGDGSQQRHYIYINDVCRAIEAALIKKEVAGVFNIGMKHAYSNLELVECVNKVFHNVGNLEHDYSKDIKGTDDEMKIEKARLELEYTPKYDLEAAFQDIAQQLRK